MINRIFIFLFTFATIASPAFSEEDTWAKWWSSVQEISAYTAKSENGNIILNVALTKPDPEKLVELKSSDGDTIGYSLNGKKLPERYWPGCAFISKFELTWDGKKIAIPERFWNDLPGFLIQVSPLNPEKVPPQERYEAIRFLDSLKKPRVILSADGNTVLIEWVRPEDCDGRSTIRWMISRSGTILRHRHTPPSEC